MIVGTRDEREVETVGKMDDAIVVAPALRQTAGRAVDNLDRLNRRNTTRRRRQHLAQVPGIVSITSGLVAGNMLRA